MSYYPGAVNSPNRSGFSSASSISGVPVKARNLREQSVPTHQLAQIGRQFTGADF
jgi:hypothetical protein